MVKRLVCLFIALWLLVAPVLASDNTIGVMQTDLEFLGVSFGTIGTDPPVNPQYAASAENVVHRINGNLSNISLVNASTFFYFRWPEIADDILVEGSVTLSTTSWTLSSGSNIYYYGFKRTGKNAGTFDYLASGTIGMWNTKNNTAIKINRSVDALINDGYLFLVVEIRTSNGSLNPSLSYSSSGSSSGTVSNTLYLDQMYYYPPTYKIKATVNLTDSTTQPLFQLYDSYNTIYAYSSGVELGDIDGTISSDDHVQMMGTIYGNSSVSLTNTSTLTASAASDVMAYANFTATYGNDGGLVDEVFDQGDTLDQIAGDMNKIVEHMQAQQDTANDIGGATSQDQIDNASATVTTGTAAINDFSDTALGSVDSHIGIFNGYAGLMGNALTIMGNFGTGALGTSWLLLVTVMIAMFAIKYALKSGG